MDERKSVLSRKKSNVYKRETRKNNSPGRRISCKDLGQGDCEGWMWIKKISIFRNKYVRRWCILKDNCFYYYIHDDDEKAEGYLHVQDFQVSPVDNFRNNNFYFKIHNDDVSFTFGCDTQRDFTKWLNKLQLSASNVEINEDDGLIGGFTLGYIRSNSSTLRSEASISSDRDKIDYGISGRIQSRYSESEESDLDSDKISEEAVNIGCTSNGAMTEQCCLRVSCKAAEPVSAPCRSTEELNELTMAAIKRIMEIERLIRDKRHMVTKIDEFLKFATTSEKIREFWEDYKEILDKPAK